MSLRKAFLAVSVVGAAATAAVFVVYPRFGRERCLQWGATDEEAEADLPGDDLLTAPDILSTRAITIDAPAAAIWPWLLQFGPGRGGAYTYDWIENLMGLNMHSADRILPEFQQLKVGDAFPLGTKGPVVRVASIDPEGSLVFRSDDGHWVWSFTLVETGDRTRLLSRNRIASPDAGPIGRAVNTAIMEPGSLVMERKMLHGLKERAERTPVPG
jgi:hypothetical protein